MDERLEQRCRELVELFAGNPVKNTFGLDLSYNQAGQSVVFLPFNPGLTNSQKHTHGGIIATMIDNAGWFAAAAQTDRWLVTVDLHIQYLEPAHQNGLTATGSVIRQGKSLATTRMEVRSDDGRLVAIGSGSYLVTSSAYSLKKD